MISNCLFQFSATFVECRACGSLCGAICDELGSQKHFRCVDCFGTSSGDLHALQKCIGFGDVWEQFFFGVKLWRVHAAAAAAEPDGMLQMEHFVVDDVVQNIGGHGRMIENAADDDGVVRRVVMAENAARFGLTPTHARPRHQAVKEARVQLLEDGIKVKEMSSGGAEAFASAQLAHQMRLAHDVVAGDIFPVTRRLSPIDGLAVHFGQQNMCDGAENGLRRALQQIGKPNQQAALAQANRIVDVGEGEELDFEFGDGGSGAQVPVSFLENFEKPFAHGEVRLARERASGAGLGG